MIVTDRALVRRSLSRQVERMVVGATMEMQRSPLAALRQAALGSPLGLALLDLDTRRAPRIEWAMKLRWLEPGAAVIAVTERLDEGEARRAHGAGIGYLPKALIGERLGEVIRAALTR